MVIQRDLPVHVWGDAPPGQPVAVSFRDETRGTEAGPTGHWSVYLKPGAAGGPFQLTVKAVTSASPGAPRHSPHPRRHHGRRCLGRIGPVQYGISLEPGEHRRQDLPAAANPQIRLLMIESAAPTTPCRRGHRWLDTLNSRYRKGFLCRRLVLCPRYRLARTCHHWSD